jgi:hypothetical protein
MVNPKRLAAIEGARLTPTEFVLTREALLQALLVWAVTLGDPSAVPPEASAPTPLNFPL